MRLQTPECEDFRSIWIVSMKPSLDAIAQSQLLTWLAMLGEQLLVWTYRTTTLLRLPTLSCPSSVAAAIVPFLLNALLLASMPTNHFPLWSNQHLPVIKLQLKPILQRHIDHAAIQSSLTLPAFRMAAFTSRMPWRRQRVHERLRWMFPTQPSLLLQLIRREVSRSRPSLR